MNELWCLLSSKEIEIESECIFVCHDTLVFKQIFDFRISYGDLTLINHVLIVCEPTI